MKVCFPILYIFVNEWEKLSVYVSDQDIIEKKW
jgi:hypothetical protein